MISRLKRTTLSNRQERALEKTLQNLRVQRRNRFRVLACINEEETSYITVRFAARLAPGNECDIIVLFVRPIDQELWSGGLQVRLARQSMLEAGLELPGVKHLKTALDVLKEEGIDVTDWQQEAAHEDAWGDPAGDNKVVYTNPEGRSVVLKLKTAPDVANGILDQYELGPYNLMILGESSSWRGERLSLFSKGIVQRVTMLSPCSVLVVREQPRTAGLLHLHRRHVTLHAGSAAGGGARPHDRRAHHAILGCAHRSGAAGGRGECRKCQGAAQSVGNCHCRIPRGRGQSGRAHHRTRLRLQDHRRHGRRTILVAENVARVDRL